MFDHWKVKVGVRKVHLLRWMSQPWYFKAKRTASMQRRCSLIAFFLSLGEKTAKSSTNELKNSAYVEQGNSCSVKSLDTLNLSKVFWSKVTSVAFVAKKTEDDQPCGSLVCVSILSPKQKLKYLQEEGDSLMLGNMFVMSSVDTWAWLKVVSMD